MVNPLLPQAEALRCQRVIIESRLVTVVVVSATPFGICPICQRASPTVHSRYTRTLGDMPWQGRAVRIRLQVRKFFCATPSCTRRIFAERLPGIAAVHARKTLRLEDALTSIGFACGGEGGARLAGQLGMPTSPDSLLRRMRRSTIPVVGTPRVLGIDDWAVRRGQRYGTILCDLERHCPIEILDDRQAGTVAAWLRDHPGVEVITRDRASFYADGATAGAPRAMQVADRFHLMQNLRQALIRTLEHRYPDLATAARALAAARSPPEKSPTAENVSPRCRTRRLPRGPTLSEQRRTRRMERYTQVIELHRLEISQRVIAKRIGINRETVRRYIRTGQFPERAPRRHAGKTDPFTEYMRIRWAEGCQNAAQLARELQALGFTGSYYGVRRRVARWRATEAVVAHENSSLRSGTAHPPSIRRLAWLLLKENADLDIHDQEFIGALFEQCPDLAAAAQLAREFGQMVRDRRGDSLEDWIQRAGDRTVPRQFRSFATGLRSDYNAVKAALTTDWSNGQVEGQVNRLKLIKRQMYGRANFDLLRQRVLHMA